ncbi:MAG: ABC transporter permease [Bacteroidales bacterium]|nr:ABC transporter permease [Bacteroidales bacterium]MDD2824082.1 ABC transporter permease [Bacteroidales bacterium]MDD3100855.1 ABC transporter permease [Bacteroidales bacterium]MDD3639497.1 ABC transporter permease [Bacteroidales bacterium]MDD3943752.1 ABC transporter permease [Bacteroidales bacterium]
MKKTLELTGQYILLMKRVFTRPEKWRIFWKQCLVEMEKLGLTSVPLIGIISIAIGAVLVIQTAFNIENPFIPKMYVGYMVRESLILEFSCTMVALILAGKVGSNISSDIGTMRLTEQIDAMEMMGINSANYLVLPKVVSVCLFNPILMLFSFMVGILGGWLIVAATGMITLSQYSTGLRFAFNGYYILYAVIKMIVFSFIIVTISALYGYSPKENSMEVGRASTRSIVTICLLILISDLMLTQLMLN